MSADRNNQGGGGRALLCSNPGRTSGTLFGRTRSEAGSGTTTPSWRLSPVTESGVAVGERTLEYLHFGQGGHFENPEEFRGAAVKDWDRHVRANG